MSFQKQYVRFGDKIDCKIVAGGKVVAVMVEGLWSEKEIDSNANVLSASTEMLAALKEIDALLPIHHSSAKMLDAHTRIRAAIAKAEARR